MMLYFRYSSDSFYCHLDSEDRESTLNRVMIAFNFLKRVVLLSFRAIFPMYISNFRGGFLLIVLVKTFGLERERMIWFWKRVRNKYLFHYALLFSRLADNERICFFKHYYACCISCITEYGKRGFVVGKIEGFKKFRQPGMGDRSRPVHVKNWKPRKSRFE